MTQKSRFPLILMIALSITPVLCIHFPRFLAFWPLLIGLASCLWLIFINKQRVFRVSRLYFACAGVISGLCLLSSLWSIAPARSLHEALVVCALLFFGGILISSFKSLDFKEIKPYGWMFPLGVMIAALLCVADIYAGLPLYEITHSKIPINTAVMNRGVIFCVLAYFLSLLFIYGLEWKTSCKILLAVTCGACVVLMLAFSQSQAAQLSFVFGLVLLATFPARWRFSYLAVGLVLLGAMLLTPFIVDYLYEFMVNNQAVLSGEDAHSWLRQAYIGNRIEIWNFVMEYAMNNPFYGHGIEATKFVDHFDHAHLYNEMSTVLHPHNFSVQLWVEFGLAGIVTAVGVFCVFLITLYRIDDIFVRQASSVIFLMTLLIASMTYGIWQGWWIGMILFLCAGTCLVSRSDLTSFLGKQD
ncbi:MAG: O-antigen ligase family protein [Alphaproteobacteria bacterium]